MKTLKMLPNHWKMLGLGLLASCLLLFGVCFRAVVHDLFMVSSLYAYDTFGAGWASTLIVIFFSVGVAILAFSQERMEDERIIAIRQLALTRTVILYLIVLVLNLAANIILMRVLRDQSRDIINQIMVVKRYFYSVPAFIMYYLLIFKVSLWSENKNLQRDEE